MRIDDSTAWDGSILLVINEIPGREGELIEVLRSSAIQLYADLALGVSPVKSFTASEISLAVSDAI